MPVILAIGDHASWLAHCCRLWLIAVTKALRGSPQSSLQIKTVAFDLQGSSNLAWKHFYRLARSAITLQHLILCDLPDALRLPVTHLNRRDLVAVGDAARDFLPSGLDFL